MASEPDISRSQRITLTVVACAALMTYAVVALTVTAVSTRLPHSHAWLGAFGSAHFVGFQIASLVVGALSDRFGRKGFMLAGCLGLSAGSLAMRWCEEPWIGVAAMALTGLGGGALGPPALALTAQVHPRRSGRMLSVVEAWFAFGAFGWPLIVAGLLRADATWRGAFTAAAVVPLALAAGVSGLRFPAFHDRHRRDLLARLRLLRLPFFLVSAVAIFAYAIAELGVQTFIPRYLGERFRTGIGLETAPLALFWGAMGLCRLMWPVLPRRLSARRMMVVSMMLAVAFHAGAVVAGNRYAVLALFGGLGLAFGAVWPLLVAGVVERYRTMAGTATGTLVSISGVGAMVGPILVGALSQALTIRAALGATIGVTLLACVACITLTRLK